MLWCPFWRGEQGRVRSLPHPSFWSIADQSLKWKHLEVGVRALEWRCLQAKGHGDSQGAWLLKSIKLHNEENGYILNHLWIREWYESNFDVLINSSLWGKMLGSVDSSICRGDYLEVTWQLLISLSNWAASCQETPGFGGSGNFLSL